MSAMTASSSTGCMEQVEYTRRPPTSSSSTPRFRIFSCSLHRERHSHTSSNLSCTHYKAFSCSLHRERHGQTSSNSPRIHDKAFSCSLHKERQSDIQQLVTHTLQSLQLWPAHKKVCQCQTSSNSQRTHYDSYEAGAKPHSIS